MNFTNSTTKRFSAKLVLCLLFFLPGISSFAAFNGVYTLNPSLAASATNYKNMVSFAQDLYGGARTDGGPANSSGGVTGPVILRVAPGITLTEQVEFRLAPGASSTNTITIKGALSSLQYSASSATAKHTIWMNGATYYTIDSLKVFANGTSLAWGIRFSNDANNNKILNSSVLVPNISTGVATSTSSTSTQAAVCFTKSSSILDYTARSATSSGRNGANNLISNCIIGGNGGNAGPTYAVFESQTDTTGNNTYSNNKIQHFYQEGIACHTGDGITISSNDFNKLGNTSVSGVTKAINLYYNVRSNINAITVQNNLIHDITITTTFYGLYYYNNSSYITGYNGGKVASVISGNKIYNIKSSTFYGMYLYYLQNSGGLGITRNQLYNNSSTSTAYYLYTYLTNKLNIDANTIRNNSTTGSMYCLYQSGSATNNNITNNLVFKNTAASSEYGMYIVGSGSGWIGNNYSNNTIAFDSVGWTSGYTYGIYMSAGSTSVPKTNNSVFNNSIYIAHKGITSSYLKYGFYNNWGYTGYLEEKNNIWFDAANMPNTTMYYGSDYAASLVNFNTMADWIAFGYSNKDMNENPAFIKSVYTDYASKNYNLNNAGNNAGILKDNSGNTRAAGAPDIGAVEGTFDVAVVATNLNLPVICAGYSDSVKMTLKNNSAYKVYNMKIAAIINNKVIAAMTVKDTIKPGLSKTVAFPSKITFSNAGLNNIKLCIFNDDVISNDTLRQTASVEKAPGGGVISLQVGSKGYANYNNKNYDVTAFDEVMSFDMSKPLKYQDADYLSKWKLNTWCVSSKGNTLSPGMWTYSHPASTVLTFTPSAAYTDSTITLYTQVVDLVTGCDTVYSRTVFVAPRGKARYNVPALICDGNSVLFDNNSSVSSGSLFYDWNFGDGSAHTDATNPSHLFPGSGVYSVTLRLITVPYGYTKDSVFNITVNATPVANFTRVNACEGQAVQFVNTTKVSSGALTYEWNFGDKSAVVTTANASRTYAKAGAYAVTLKATANGCSNTVTKNAYEFATPKASFTVNAGDACENTMFSFNSTSTLSSGDFGYFWSFDDAGNHATLSSPLYNFKSAGSKTVKLLVESEFGCKDSFSQTVLVKARPVSMFTFGSTCSLDPTQFSNSTLVPAGETASYTWNFGEGSTSSASDPSYTWHTIGSKTVTLKTLLSNGCKDEISKQLTVGVQPRADFMVADYCAGQSVPFENVSTWAKGNISYEWEFGDGGTSLASDPVYVYRNTMSQTYNVKLRAKVQGGCQDSVVKSISISAAPSTCDFDVIYDGATGHRNYKFIPKGGSTSGISYHWLIEDGGYVEGSDARYAFLYDGNFTVTMTARNATGCECTKAKDVRVAWAGVKDIDAASVSVFPNPGNGRFAVKLSDNASDIRTEVYSLAGALLHTQKSTETHFEMDMTGFANGMYLLKIYYNNTSVTKRVTINK